MSLPQNVLGEVRTQLGDPSDSSADVSPRVSWRALPVRLEITARGDGPIVGVVRGPLVDSSASTLLAHAFENAQRKGAVLMPWRNKAGAEPVVVSLWLSAPSVDSTGKWKRPDPNDLTAFWTQLPARSDLKVVSLAKLRYPKENERNHAEGDVRVRFVVDSTGRAQATTIHDVPPDDRAVANMTADEYDAFVVVTREWVLNSTYSPERIGGCAIESMAEQPVKFRFP